MKFKLYENNRGPVKGSSMNTLNENGGQTELKELMVNITNDSLNIDLDPEDYCVHHLFGEHYNNTLKELSITDKSNHAAITNYMRSGNISGLRKALEKCYIIKAYAQALAPKDADEICKEINKRYQFLTDPKTGVKWKIFSYDIWHFANPIANPKHNKDASYKEFDSKESLDKFIKTLK